MRVFLLDRVIQEDGLYVYNMHNVEEQHLSTRIVAAAGH
jgi:hypothetical protein